MNDTNTNKADDMNEDDVTLTGSEGENTAVESDATADATADTATIRALVPDAVAAEDRERFITLVREEFMSLHPGNAIRFGLRPLEYAAWRAANPDGEPH